MPNPASFFLRKMLIDPVAAPVIEVAQCISVAWEELPTIRTQLRLQADSEEYQSLAQAVRERNGVRKAKIIYNDSPSENTEKLLLDKAKEIIRYLNYQIEQQITANSGFTVSRIWRSTSLAISQQQALEELMEAQTLVDFSHIVKANQVKLQPLLDGNRSFSTAVDSCVNARPSPSPKYRQRFK